MVVPLSRETGEFEGPVRSIHDPRQGEAAIAAAKKDGGVDHSMNDESTVARRDRSIRTRTPSCSIRSRDASPTCRIWARI